MLPNMCWLRGLASSEKLAKYWFLTISDSQGDSLKSLTLRSSSRASAVKASSKSDCTSDI